MNAILITTNQTSVLEGCFGLIIIILVSSNIGSPILWFTSTGTLSAAPVEKPVLLHQHRINTSGLWQTTGKQQVVQRHEESGSWAWEWCSWVEGRWKEGRTGGWTMSDTSSAVPYPLCHTCGTDSISLIEHTGTLLEVRRWVSPYSRGNSSLTNSNTVVKVCPKLCDPMVSSMSVPPILN